MGAEAKHRPVIAVIKGSGFNSNGGGFARIDINGARYHPDDVAKAVECHSDMLASLKAVARDVTDMTEIEAFERWQLVISAVRAAIAKAEGRSNG